MQDLLLRTLENAGLSDPRGAGATPRGTSAINPLPASNSSTASPSTPQISPIPQKKRIYKSLFRRFLKKIMGKRGYGGAPRAQAETPNPTPPSPPLQSKSSPPYRSTFLESLTKARDLSSISTPEKFTNMQNNPLASPFSGSPDPSINNEHERCALIVLGLLLGTAASNHPSVLERGIDRAYPSYVAPSPRGLASLGWTAPALSTRSMASTVYLTPREVLGNSSGTSPRSTPREVC